ncbi:MAG: T9SS type A sorting domain-containing protein, partial [Saprospiraceae bacterium]|nr:T9SS type A sorting domain-containing protein [Saprospiraceae bacterium]
RLKQTDYDGKFEYFPPVAVNIGVSAVVDNQIIINSIGPNPFSSTFNVEFETQSPEALEVYLYNIRGQIVYKDVYQPQEGTNKYTYTDNIGLSPGYYILSMKQSNLFSKGMKVIKQ